MSRIQLVHYDKPLANLSIGYTNGDFVSSLILPEVTVDKASDKYYVFGDEAFLDEDDSRKQGGLAREVSFSWSSDYYNCEEHAMRTFVTQDEVNNADDPNQLVVDAMNLVTQKILLRKETNAATMLLNTANYNANLVYATGGSEEPLQWSDENSDPLGDIANVKATMHSLSGIEPNTLLISLPVYNVLRRHPALLALYKNTEMSIIPLNVLKEFLEIDNIIIGRAQKKTTVSGAKGYIWGKAAILAYVTPNPGKKIQTFGYSFAWNKNGQGTTLARTYDDIPAKKTFYEAERWYGHKIVCQNAGAILPDIIE